LNLFWQVGHVVEKIGLGLEFFGRLNLLALQVSGNLISVLVLVENDGTDACTIKLKLPVCLLTGLHVAQMDK